MPATLNPFSPMAPERRSRLFGERRVYGKGGQFAKGGGRIPAATDIPALTPGAAWETALGMTGGKMTKELAAEIAARPRLLATGGTPPTGPINDLRPGSHPISKGWVKEVMADNPDLGPAPHMYEKATAANHLVRGRAKALIVNDLSKRMVDDPQFEAAVNEHLDHPLTASPKPHSFEAYTVVPFGSYTRFGDNAGDEAATVMTYVQRSLRSNANSDTEMNKAYQAAWDKHGPDGMTVRHFLDEYEARTGISAKQVVARGLAQDTIDVWAGTSSDSNPGALAGQLSAAVVHGSPLSPLRSFGRAGGEAFKEAQTAFVKRDSLNRAYLRAEYAATQDYFASKGITHVTLTRGYHQNTHANQVNLHREDTIRVETNPLTSWSTSTAVARRFGSTVVQMTVPVSMIQSCARTGRGCLNEYEVVVVGSAVSEGLVTQSPYWK